MTDYIEREAVREVMYHNQAPLTEYQLDEIPAADVAPVRHGRWIDKPTGKYRQWQSWCSACENRSGIGGIESNQHKPYCPNCGARCDLGGTDNG